jgi:hypothetical protein
VRNAQFLPPTLQTPRIPVWLAAHWPNREPFRRAARWDGVFPEFPHGGDELAQLDDLFRFVRAERRAVRHRLLYRSVATTARRSRACWRHLVAGADRAHSLRGTWERPWPLDAMRAFVKEGPPIADR